VLVQSIEDHVEISKADGDFDMNFGAKPHVAAAFRTRAASRRNDPPNAMR